jgi:hypothetical protein
VSLLIEAPVYDGLRLTVPAHEALVRAGNTVREAGYDGAFLRHTVILRRPPPGLVHVRICGTSDEALRLDIEPEYPSEVPGAWYEQGQWTPCPTCGFALVWYEAGYVPGWRICLQGHASQLSDDGRKAIPHPEADIDAQPAEPSVTP